MKETETEMITITDTIYRLVAARLREEIGNAEWFNGALQGILPATGDAVPSLPVGNVVGTCGTAVAAGDEAHNRAVEWHLTLTAIVYRRTEILPEGVRRPISDVVPVWWEFSTVGDEGQYLNDFSFAELKTYLIDYD